MRPSPAETASTCPSRRAECVRIVPLPLSGPVHSATHERAVTCWDSVRSPGEARLRSGTRHTRFRSTSVSGPSVAGGSKKKALVSPQDRQRGAAPTSLWRVVRGNRCPLEIYQFLEPLLALLAARRRNEKRIAALATI